MPEMSPSTLTTIGEFIASKKFTLGDLIETLTFLTADALSQVTEGKYDAELFATVTTDFAAAYRICCGRSADTTQTTH